MKKKALITPVFIIFFSFTAFTQDFSYDKEIGAESAVQVEQMIGIYRDSALTAYVNAVGQRLVEVLGDSPVGFQFQIVDMSEPNAFALPGGYIYVSRGLLSLINDEAELACVMGHEMIHVTKRHSVKQMKKSILPGLLHIPGAIVGVFNSNLGNLINTPISIGSELFLSNYSRKQESEADKYGVKLASEAGYDPEKLAVILSRLSEDVELLTGEDEQKSYFSSHPFTPKRVESIEKEITGLDWSEKPSIAPDKEALYHQLDGMVYGSNTAQGIFDSNIFKHPDLNLAITFPKKWQTMNVPVAVGASQADGEAQFIFMVENRQGPLDSLGNALAGHFKKEYNITPDENRPLDINGFPAWVVSTTNPGNGQPVKMQVYWIKAGEKLINFLGVSYPKYNQTITGVVTSFRPLTTAEKGNMTIQRMRTSKALDNETLKDFMYRTNNRWDLKTTVLKNDLETDTVLEEGQLLKIASEESYNTM